MKNMINKMKNTLKGSRGSTQQSGRKGSRKHPIKISKRKKNPPK